MFNYTPESTSQEIAVHFTRRAEDVRRTEESGGDGNWEELDEDIRVISTSVPPNCLYSTALNLINTKEGYQVNIGLGIIATEPIIEFAQTNQAQLDEILDIVKPQCLLLKTDPHGPDLYNLIWAMEILLRLRAKADEKSLFLIDDLITQIPSTNLTHISVNSNAGDLSGTLVQQYFTHKNL